MAVLRSGEVTMKGNPVYLVGPKWNVGDPAPDFACVGQGLSIVRLKDTGANKVRLFSVVPSLDTPVCNVQTRKFAEELNKLGDQVAAYTISLDLPFAMTRFCNDAGIQNLANLSDVYDLSFGRNYGVLIEGLPIQLLARAVFVVDAHNILRYIEIVPEIAQEPNYVAALGAVQVAVQA